MTAERKSGIILAIITVLEAGWVLLNLQASGWRFTRYLGFAPGMSGNLAGWIAAVVATAIFVAFALRLPRGEMGSLRAEHANLTTAT